LGISIRNILAEKPKLLPFFPAMKLEVATALKIAPEKMQVKAKTMEGIGIIGTEQAIAAEAVVLLVGNG
jgi:2-C-methyl-D-erythritol 2,4-cyclodiphosphate synthase